MPKLYPQLPIKDQIYVTSGQEKISQLIQSGKAAYIAVDSNKENNDFSNKDKRKLICVLENKKNKKISIKEYDNDEFVNNFSINADCDLVSKQDKKNPQKVRAILYVKTSELHGDLGKLKENTLISIDKRIANLIQNRKTEEYENYPQMREAYDAETGESIKSILEKLNSTINKIEERILELEGENFETSVLKELLNKMKLEKINSEGKNKESESYSFMPLVNYFLLRESEFNKEVEKLCLEKEYNEFIGKITDLKIKSGNICSPHDSYPEYIFKIRDAVNNSIIGLSKRADEEKKNITKEQLNSLQEAYVIITGNLNVLECEVNSKKQKNTSTTDEKYDQILHSYRVSIEPSLKAVEEHVKKTSPDKAKILNQIISFLQDIKDRITQKSPLEEIQKAIKEIETFIKDKYMQLTTSNGVFFKTTSGPLTDKLNKNLKEFSDNVDQEFCAKPEMRV